MKRFKSLLGLMIIFALVFSMTACGGSEEQAVSTDDGPSLKDTEWAFFTYGTDDRRKRVETFAFGDDEVTVEGKSMSYKLITGDEAFEAAGVKKEDFEAILTEDLFGEGSGSGSFITIQIDSEAGQRVLYGFINDTCEKMNLELDDEYGNLYEYMECENKASDDYADIMIEDESGQR